MIITCKACSTSFNLDDKMLKPTGSKVRCSVCANVFTVFPEAAPSSDTANGQAEPDNASGPAPIDDEKSGALGDTATVETTHTDGTPVSEVDDAVSKALEEDLEDLDLEISDTEESEATMLADLDDDDLEFDLSDESLSGDDMTATVVADLDDDDFDLAVDEQPDSDETVIVDLDGEDLDLDIPVEADDADDSVTMVITDLDEGDAIDLDDDSSLEPEEKADIADPSEDALMEELGDLDLSLDLEAEDDALATGASDADPADVEMDDLTLDFEVEAETGEDSESLSGKDDAGEDEMALALDLESDGTGEDKPDATLPVLEDDLDMSSLEEMFDEPADDDSATMVVGEGDLSEMALELEDEPAADDAGDTGTVDETLSDLELELDEDASAGAGRIDEADSELDLSEIEKMLEEPQAGGQRISVPEQDLELDVEASLESEKWMSDDGKDQLVADEELDLSELEQVLEDVDTSNDDDTAEDQELELDLSEDNDPAKAEETVVVDSDLEFDLSDFDEHASPQSEAGDKKPADMELEFELEEDGREDQTAASDGLEETVVMAGGGGDAGAVPAGEKMEQPVAAPPTKPARKPVKKGTSKSLVFLLILIILGGAAYGTYYYLDKNGIEIPFVSDYLKPKVQDPGNLKLTTHDINSRFIENANVGKLFVITGKVKNGYADNRGMVSIVGKIFSSGKVAVNQENVYCGNVMSDLELANLEWDKIQARLANRLGDNRSNVKIEPGKSIPFMVVFSGLPDDLEEFTIEVTGSTSLK